MHKDIRMAELPDLIGNIPDKPRYHGEAALAIRKARGCSILLADVIDPNILSARLHEDFVYRPWPTHSLEDRFVDREYIPSIPEAPEGEMWNMEIIEDERVRVDGTEKGVRGNRLKLLNLRLLTRDWRLRRDEYFMLGFADYTDSLRSKISLLQYTDNRLRQIAAPRSIFETIDTVHDWREGSARARLSPALRIIDLR